MKRNLAVFSLSFLILFSANLTVFCTDFCTLNDVKIVDNKIDIYTSGRAKYNVFKISNPPRLVIELFNVEQDMKQKNIEIKGKIVKRIRIGQFQNEPVKIARIVLDLSKQFDYNTSQKDGLISLQFLEEVAPIKPVVAAKKPEVPTKAVVSTPPQKKAEAIQEKPLVKVPSKAPEPEKKVEPAVVTSTIIAEPKPEIPVVTQPAPKEVTKPKEKVTTKITAPAIQPVKEVKPAAKKTVAPAVKKEIPKKIATKQPTRTDFRIIGNITLPKTPVTMEYFEAEIQDVLQVLSLRSGINIIAGSDVTGKITISLKDVPFDQAFNTILTIKGLTSIAVGENVLQVITPAALTSQRQQEIVITKIYPLNYADAPIISGQIKSVFNSEGLKGDVNIDARTNSILVTASLEGHSAVEKMLGNLDVKPQQVMIESKVVDVNLSDANELGVSWSVDNISVSGAGTSVTSGGRTQTANPPGTPSVSISQAGKTGQTIRVIGAQSAMASPIGSALSFTFGYVSDSSILNTRLGLLATEGRIRLLSNPKVSTVNNKEARIMVGEKIPYKTTTIGQGGVSQESYQFLDAGIQLTVMPTISPDGWITLKVRPIVSVPLAAPAGQAPTIRTRETDVTVMVKNGDTIVIGGLISDSEIEQMEKIPILGDIPIFGALFKHKSNQKTRSELLIFITPRILEG